MDLPESHQFAMQRQKKKRRTWRRQTSRRKKRGQPMPRPMRLMGRRSQMPSRTALPEMALRLTAPMAPTGRPGAATRWRFLAEAAGYKDHELWWEHQIERRSDATGLFAAILEAMRSVREGGAEVRERDLLREACMRKTLRGVVKEGFEKIAVVCGAWHAPVLDADAVAGKRDGCKVFSSPVGRIGTALRRLAR